MYSQKLCCYFQNRIIMFCLPVPSLIYLWEIYIFPGSVCLFCCRETCGLWTDPGNILIALRHMNVEIPRKGIHKWDFPCCVEPCGTKKWRKNNTLMLLWKCDMANVLWVRIRNKLTSWIQNRNLTNYQIFGEIKKKSSIYSTEIIKIYYLFWLRVHIIFVGLKKSW